MQLKIAALLANEILILWNGKSMLVPALYRDNTTYVPVWYVMQLLHQTGVQSTWTGRFWYVQSTSQPNLENIHPGTGTASIYLDGVLVQNVTPAVTLAVTNEPSTTFMAISPVAQLLSRLGLQSNWNGTLWTVTPLNQ
ncbi:MAG: hypothetical protein A2201_04220 [Alicyclobacillus sp. RIFOXYA1_FULL_53_8]|nr:MAG: hypothetical protein A2201_04220 [Alicyclobacillus sp. RIFOXYA1_FULL_53_8]